MRLTTLRGDDLDKLIVRSDDDIRAAMLAMNESGRTLVLVVDGGRLQGVVSDGDIRRFLTGGGALAEPVGKATNVTPATVSSDAGPDEIRAQMIRLGLDYLPVVDGGSPVALCVLESVPRPSDLSAFVLAGGLGSRLAPLTDTCPKPLLPLGGQPILSHIIGHLRSQGVSRFTLAVNYLADEIIDHYEDGSRLNAFIEYVHETKRLGTGGPLGLVHRDSLSDPFLCINGDIVSDVDVGALYDTHVANGFDATMVVRPYRHTVPYGVVDVDDQGRFAGVDEKPVLSFQINAGIYMLSKSVLDLIPRNEFYDLPTLFEELPGHGLSGGVYAHSGRWIDIGSRSEYERAQAIFDGSEEEQ